MSKPKNFDRDGLAPEVIRALLMMKKIRQVDIAREHGVTKGAVTLIIDRAGESYPLKQLIADLLELPYEVVWGRRKAA